MHKTLLPTGSTALEKAASVALSRILTLPIALRTLMDPDTCPVHLLPYLAWSFSVDRWDKDWSEKTKREAIKAALFIHQHKGTIGALRRVVEPLGYLIRVIEWWKTGDAPGTFRLDIGVLESGITESMYHEIEALIEDAKPASRHLLGLSIQLETRGTFFTGASVYLGDELTVYAYTPALISTRGTVQHAVALHLIDTVRITAS
ncbi:phage tail protein I (plasmid) [Arsenophonus nasoniae]|uniref:Phage tail protein (Tail_P2_I) n=1 Tax=Arsenophonus nasoniae TaxID=638 RepID=A0A4P7LCS2_9GAMM|nr:phage tail protein I [Arsenophonus nasoniae]QBY46922.1 Phage tail protein (Tail_P2_I) [Arsenophonus nasoniae]WGM08273.1 phage tail protein I [Arsenophonus nasoniae]WGM13127.1 phage tail protein I [Arsenophonus nasoniae]WGM13810.1 phage tail protein I [Arsenophonus nasoniae]WGM17700.1 phage tail protein I [Arsenophonus nasoniae]